MLREGLRVVTAVVRRRQWTRPGVAIAAVVACGVAAGVPAVASAGGAGRPARQGDVTPGYRAVAKIPLPGHPIAIAQDPLTGMTYVAEQGPSSNYTVAVINDRTDKVVATLGVFADTFAFDSR